jgi:hypothetical protein
MGRELGRISGPLLADNLRRNGTNLAFETRLLYLNVTGNRIGVNTLAPAYELDVNNSFRTTNLNVSTQASLANLELYTNNIQNVVGNIVISPNQASNPTIVVPQLQATNLFFSGNTLSDTVTDADINVSLAAGNTTGQIKLNNNTLVNADLHATGDITWDGNITLGDNQAQDTVFFGSQISSDIVPDATTYDLGNNTTPLKWATVYVNTTSASVTGIVDVTTTNLTGSGTNLLNGNVVIGTNSSNTLTVTARINTNLIPSVTNTYNLGSATGPKHWNNVYGVTFNNSNITVSGSTIQTNTTNSSLQLVANGIGQVIFSKLAVTNNVTVGGTFGVTGASTLTNTTTGAITQTGDYNLTGDTGITGNLSSVNITQIDNGSGGVGTTGFLLEDGTDLLQEDNTNLLFLETLGSSVFLQLPGVTIISSNINSTVANTDLQITANGSGKILIPTNDVQFDQNLTVGQTLGVTGTSTLTNTSAGVVTLAGDYNQTGNFVTTGSISSGSITAANPLTLPNITINGTVITGTVANTPLTLTPYAGRVVQITRSALIDQNLTVGQALSVSNTSSLTNTTTGAITLVGDYNQTGNFVTTGTVSTAGITATNPFVLPGLTFNGTVITGTLSSSDLILTAKAGQQVKITSSGKVNGDLSVGQGSSSITYWANYTGTDFVYFPTPPDPWGIYYWVTGSYLEITLSAWSNSSAFNNLLTVSSGSVLQLDPAGYGSLINFTSTSGWVSQGNGVYRMTGTWAFGGPTWDSGITNFKFTYVNSTGLFTVGGTSTLTNTTTGAIALAGDYNQTGNFVTTGTINSGSITAANPLTLPNVTINGSTITGTVTDTNLTLTPKAGFRVDLSGTTGTTTQVNQNLTVGGTFSVFAGSTLTNTTTGAITLVGDYNQTGNFVTTGSISSGNITAANPLVLPNITIDGSVITGTVANTDLTLTPYTGQVVDITSNARVDNNLTVTGTLGVTSTSTLTNTTTGAITLVGDYNQTGNFVTTGTINSGNITAANPLTLPTLTLNGSVITGTANSNLTLTPNTNQLVKITSSAKVNNNLDVAGTLTVAGTSTLTNTSATTVTLAGNYNQTGNFVTTGAITSGSITSSAPLVMPSLIISGVTGSGTTTTYTQGVDYSAGGIVYLSSFGPAISVDSAAFSNIAVFNDIVSRLTGQAWTISGTGVTTVTVIQQQAWPNYFPGAKISTVSPVPDVSAGWTSYSTNITSISYVVPAITAASAIVGVNTNTNLIFTPYAGDIVEITSPAKVNQNLRVYGDLTIGGLSILDDDLVTGPITLTGDYNQTGNFVTTGTISSAGITATNPLVLPSVTINGTTITGTTTNTDLTFTAKAGQQVRITSNATIDQNLSVGGTLTVGSTSTLTNTVTGAITQTGNYNLTGNANITGNKSGVNITLIDNGGNAPDFLLEDGTDLLQEDGSLLSLETSLLSSAYLQLPNVTISGSTIAGTATNTDLTVTANGTGKILIPSNDVRIEQNLTVGTFNETNAVSFVNPVVGAVTQTGDFNQTGNSNITGTVTAADITGSGVGSQFDIGNFRIAGQTITSTVTGGSITLQGNGTGAVWIDGYLKISGNRLINNWINASVPYIAEDLQIFVSEDGQNLYTELGAPSELQNSINFIPTGTGNVIVNSNKAIKLPSANDSNVLLADNGDIRFNNINSNIEGYKNTGYVSFINLYSQNYTTYVTPELTPNTSDNLLRFGIAGNITTTISSTTVTSSRLTSGNITVNSNTIQNTDPATAVNLTTSGTGRVKFNSVNFVNGDNFHVPTSGAITFASTSQGYVKFTGTAGLVVPSGTSSNYPSGPELGTVRFRTTDSVLQVYNGSSWVSADGGDSLTLDDISDLVQVYTIILGF